jgi:hypothetical protein
LVFNSNSHYETDFGVSSAEGAGNTKIGFFLSRQTRGVKKHIFLNIISEFTNLKGTQSPT